MATYNYPIDFLDTQWQVIDGDVYVSSIGNDTDGDGSPNNPYQKVQKGIEEASTGAKIVIGTGTYLETIDGQQKGIIFHGDGTVIFSGTIDDVAVDGWGNMGENCQLIDCTFQHYNLVQPDPIQLIQRCKFINLSVIRFGGRIENTLFKDAELHVTQETVIQNSTCINSLLSSAGGVFSSVKDVILDATSNITASTTSLQVFDFCNQEPGSTVEINGTIYSNAASVNTDFSNYQTNGKSELVEFNFPEYGDYSLNPFGSLRGTGSKGHHLGAFSQATSKSAKTLAIVSTQNVKLNTDNKYQLEEGFDKGCLTTEIIDLQRNIVLGRINLFADQLFETPPFNEVVDSRNVFSKPNAQTFEMRYANELNEQGEITSNYQPFIWDKVPSVDKNGNSNGTRTFDVSSINQLTARYLQLKITLYAGSCDILQESNCELLTEDNCILQLENCEPTVIGCPEPPSCLKE